MQLGRAAQLLLAATIACGHSSIKAIPLDIQLDIDNASFEAGALSARALILIKSGTARFFRIVEPMLEVQNAVDCDTGEAMQIVVVDVHLRDRPVIDIDNGYWYGKNFRTTFLDPSTKAPVCMNLTIRATGRNANDPNQIASAIAKIQVFTRNPSDR